MNKLFERVNKINEMMEVVGNNREVMEHLLDIFGLNFQTYEIVMNSINQDLDAVAFEYGINDWESVERMLRENEVNEFYIYYKSTSLVDDLSIFYELGYTKISFPVYVDKYTNKLGTCVRMSKDEI